MQPISVSNHLLWKDFNEKVCPFKKFIFSEIFIHKFNEKNKSFHKLLIKSQYFHEIFSIFIHWKHAFNLFGDSGIDMLSELKFHIHETYFFKAIARKAYTEENRLVNIHLRWAWRMPIVKNLIRFLSVPSLNILFL